MITDDSRLEFRWRGGQLHGLSTVCGRCARLVVCVLLASLTVGNESGLPLARLCILKRDGFAGATLAFVLKVGQARVPVHLQGRPELGDGLQAGGHASSGAHA